GSIVGTVATTTTSPDAASSARIIRSISDALALSRTWAKSLTGWVSRGIVSAARAVAINASTTNDEPSTANGRLSIICPAVYVFHETLDGVEVRREQTVGFGGG